MKYNHVTSLMHMHSNTPGTATLTYIARLTYTLRADKRNVRRISVPESMLDGPA